MSEHLENKSTEPRWYVVHTRTGYENKVATDLEKTVENRGLQDLILEITIPTEEVTEIKDGKKKVFTRKLYPCYIMVKMILTSQTWYIVRNATGVTGFVGSSTDPVPLTDEEVVAMGVERVPLQLDVEVGDSVRINTGPLEDFIGTVQELDEEKQKVKVLVKMFGRDTSVDLDFIEVQRAK